MNDLSTFLIDFSEWAAPSGMIQNAPHPSDDASDNGQVWTAAYLVCKMRRFPSFFNADTEYVDRILNACQIKPGLIATHPNSTRYQSVDNLVGIFTMSLLGQTRHAREVLNYLDDHWWWYRIEPQFMWKDWFIRFVALRAHAHVCTWQTLSLVPALAWKRSVSKAAKAGLSQDEWVLSWLLIESGHVTNRMFPEETVKNFVDALEATWGADGMKAVFRRYFSNGHPLGKWAPNIAEMKGYLK